MNNTAIRRSVLIFFFLSGITGLVYEVIWMRMLAIIFGGTTLAVSTVLAVFMGGLALGSYAGGRYAERAKAPFLIFGLLELGIGFYSLFIPFLFRSLMDFYPLICNTWIVKLVGVGGLRFTVSFLLLFLPTVLMGATFPVISKFYAQDYLRWQKDISALYGVNTLGAVLGAVLCGFMLIFYLGVSKTIFLAAAVNIFIAALVLWFHRLYIGKGRETGEGPQASCLAVKDIRQAPGGCSRIIVWVSFFSGVAAFIYQVSFVRALSLFFGSSVYAISAVLAAFILGLAIGSFLAGRILKNKEDIYILGLSQLRIAFGAALFMAVYIKLPAALVWLHSFLYHKFWLFQLAQFLLVLLILLYPTVWMGLSFPLAVSIYARGKAKIGQAAGVLSSFNTLGCVLGSLAGGFILIPWIGTQYAIILAIFINLALGFWVFIFSQVHNKWRQPLFGGILIAALLILRPGWDKEVLVSGYYARLFTQQAHLKKLGVSVLSLPEEVTEKSFNTFGSLLPARVNQESEKIDIVYYKEGVNSTIAILRQGRYKTLKINGKADASTFEIDLKTQLFLGYIPLALHPDPQKILVIGLGSGCTAGTFINYPQVKAIDCVEIEPAVVEAARYFAPENNYFFNDPRLRVIVDDARSFVLASRQKYDIISSEPSNLYMGGVSTLFTREHFLACLRALSENGIMCQWVHAYQLSRQDLGIIFNTFKSVFKYTALFSNADDLILIGSQKPISRGWQKGKQEINTEKIRLQLESVGLSSLSEIDKLRGYKNIDIDALAKDAKINTDDYPILEFSVPRSQY